MAHRTSALMGGVFIAMEASAVADAEQPVAVNQPDGVKADQSLVSTYLRNFARIHEPFDDSAAVVGMH